MSPRGAILVTGASSGSGEACALRLSRAGFTVFAGVRREADARRLRELGTPGLVPLPLDVTSAQAIAEAFRTVRDAVGAAGLPGLAGLVNNAGIAVTGPVEFIPVDELRRQFEVNVFGHVAVTQAFLPLVRAARGRIVNVGSVGARFALPFAGALNASKAALESLNDALRMELRPWGIHVVLISPGSIRTAAEAKLVADGAATLARFPPDGRALYGASYRAFIQAMADLEKHGVGPEVVARAVHGALTARTPRRRIPVGPRSRLLPLLFTRLPASAADALRLRMFHVYRRFGEAVR